MEDMLVDVKMERWICCEGLSLGDGFSGFISKQTEEVDILKLFKKR